ncbi:MAG: carbohydrate binding family 9 domain-containing protein [Bacteroidales bacterium]|nr:carbohydrate binding family 9 domain-containing protein [Bacteroidales bacterium]
MIKYAFLFILLIPWIVHTHAQETVRSIHALRISDPPKIDGNLDDAVWKNALVADDFIQFWPDNGALPCQQSEVRFLYDNTALYVGAILYDTAPDSILTGLSERDNINNADYMGVYLDPQGNGTNGYGFFVTSSGIQVDMKLDQYSEDGSWDAVWMSETSITDSGWVAELKIPYSAIRFPKMDVQHWKVNVWRNVMRHRQNTNWNFVDRDKDGILPQSGNLLSVEGIDPALRLSFTPYVSTYFEKNPESDQIGTAFNGGMDIKYGLNESFTLDMTLVPDFGQVQSDDKILNLSPFETYYTEKRPFFNEGTELFNKLGLFHSRRIGGTPVHKGGLEGQLNEGDTLMFNPAETRMLNATKISGRTSSGLGIGVFNAMTMKAEAVVADSNGVMRAIVTQPFTNYNMLVLDQDLKNNSYLNFSNTNYYRPDDKYSANVSGTELVIKDKARRFRLQSKGVLSQKYSAGEDTELGYSYFVEAAKVSGKFQASIAHLVLSDNYDINEMGFMQQNNYTSTEAFIQYERNNPFWKLNSLHTHIYYERESLYDPRVLSNSSIWYNLRATSRKLYTIALNASYYPKGKTDFYEPRVEGRFVKLFKKQYHIGGWIETDSRKKFSFLYNPGIRWWDDEGRYQHWQFAYMNLRLSDKFSFYFEFNFVETFNEPGWINTDENDENLIYFGRRNITNITNSASVKYVFNKSSYLSLRMRHYNMDVIYRDQFYELKTDGELSESAYTANHNQSYNAFNIDMQFAWRYAPGSEISVVWKNAIDRSDDVILPGYFENLGQTITYPQTNSISVKVIYYLDYLNLLRK